MDTCLRNHSLPSFQVIDTAAHFHDLTSDVQAEDRRVLQAEEVIVLQDPVDRINGDAAYFDHDMTLWW